MNEPTQPKRLINRQGIAELAGVTPAAVTNWITRPNVEFPASIDGELFDADEVQRWLADARPARRQRVTANRLAVDLLAPLRGELTVEDAAAYALTVLTIAAKTPHAPESADALGLAEQLEESGAVEAPALTGPLGATSLSDTTKSVALSTARTAIALGDRHGIPPVAIFEALLQRAEGPAGRGRGESSTPAGINHFMVRLLPRDAATLYDPACGLGGTLLAGADWLGQDRVTLTGGEINRRAWALCVQRMTMHGQNATIRREDSTHALVESSSTFDAIVSSPPINLHLEPDNPLVRVTERRLVVSRAGSDWAWALAALDHLKVGGTAVTTVSSGALFTGAMGDRQARLELVRTGALKAVFLLPPGSLKSTAIRVAVLVLGRPVERPSTVLLAQLDTDDLTFPEAILARFAQWRRDPQDFVNLPGKAVAVPALDLLGGEINLNPLMWVGTQTNTELQTQLSETWQGLQSSQRELPGQVPGQPTLIDANSPRLVSLRDLKDQALIDVIRYTPSKPSEDVSATTERIWDVDGAGRLYSREPGEGPRAGAFTQAGDVIIRTVGKIAAAVDHEGGHPISRHLWLIRPLVNDPRVHPELLALLLSSHRVNAIAEATATTGAARLRAPRDVTIPLLSNDEASELLDTLRPLLRMEQTCRAVSESAAAAAQSLVEAAEAGMVIAPSDKPGKEAK